MNPLSFDDIKSLFENEYNLAQLANESAAQRRAESYLDSLKALETWPKVKAAFVNSVNDYRRTVDAIACYLVYATRIKTAPDPMLDVLISAGNRRQLKVIEAFIDEVDEDERVARARDISRILSKDVGRFIADAPSRVLEVES